MGADKLLFPGTVDLSTINPLQLPLSARPGGPPQDVGADLRPSDVAVAGRPFEDEPADKTAAPREQGLKVLAVTHDGVGGFNVDVENGQKLHTTERPVAKACDEARKQGTPLLFEVETRAGLLEIVEFVASSPY